MRAVNSANITDSWNTGNAVPISANLFPLFEPREKEPSPVHVSSFLSPESPEYLS